MLSIRKSSDRGHFDFGWLDTCHSFSFGDYRDPAHMGFGALRVINEDRVAPGAGFPSHPHRDMEIVTWVLEGALAHKDSAGGGHEGVIRPGDLQRMSAGTGVVHSEANPSRTEPVHLIQIWIRPERAGLAPAYEQKTFARASGLTLLASPDGRAGSVTIHQDAELFVARLGAAAPRATLALRPGRRAWVQVTRAGATVNGAALRQGDGAAVTDEASLVLESASDGEALVFDLA